MRTAAWPRPPEILEHHRRLVEVLRLAPTITADAKSAFFGLTPDELDDVLRRARQELDDQVVLALVASAEATIRTDFDERLLRKTKCALRPRFKELRDRHADRVPLDDVLEACKDEAASTDRIGRFRQLVQRRHWLAHGRYWTDKSGVAPDPGQAQLVIEDMLAAFTLVAPGFPLG